MSMTGKKVFEETSEDWDERFEEGWQKSGGNFQSLIFAYGAMQQLQQNAPELYNAINDIKFLDNRKISAPAVTIHDYGCALGDGTALLQAAFPMATVKGFDFSPEGVATAQKRWPTIEFEVGDVTAPAYTADIIFCSHVLEHVKDTAATLNNLCEKASWVLALVPIVTEDKTGGHDGAEPTDEWLKRVHPEYNKTLFNTYRKVGGQTYPETSVMLLLRGSLAPATANP